VDDRPAKRLRGRHRRFAVIAKTMVAFTGSGWAVALIVAVVAAWLTAGVALRFSRGWELSMTAGVPVLTLALLVVVQHTQNHDNLALQLKLDELIRAHGGTEDHMMRVEDASRDDLERLEGEFKARADDARR
jgi:low affinity Fe/Cu permease